MNSTLPAALDFVRAQEGGWSDHPRDPGGCTNMGITLATYRAYIDRHGTCADLKRLSWQTAAQIYRSGFWDAVRGDDLPAGIDLLLFDMAVNAGPAPAIRLLQQTLSAVVDGRLGPQTLRAVRAAPAAALIDDYTAARRRFYRGLSTWRTFGTGWERRAAAARDAALILLERRP